MDVAIIGAGIGGLTLGLRLQQAGIACRIYEAASEIGPLGAGLNLPPHASEELTELGLQNELAKIAVTTRGIAYYNRFGQIVADDPCGRFAGYEWPQFSIRRGDLLMVLLEAFTQRAGGDRIFNWHRCTGIEQDDSGVTVHFEHVSTNRKLSSRRADAVIACDGVHSAIRRQFFPDEGQPRYSGINTWRGVTLWPPFLDGATVVRIGCQKPAMALIYPIRGKIDGEGRQLVSWLCGIEREAPIAQRDWNRPGGVEDFIDAIEDWRFPWLDVPALCRAADRILEYPLLDQDPLPRWSHGRVTLLGDAAHPMPPHVADGGAQTIIDCSALADCLRRIGDPVAALAAYEERRRPATAQVMLTSRSEPERLAGAGVGRARSATG
jgi:2-polyprenyl-6-methoxyphenol hydroxylase-like FAD-dependent oxidoreductase